MLSRLTQKVVVLRSRTRIPAFFRPCKKGISGGRTMRLAYKLGLSLGDRNSLCFPVAGGPAFVFRRRILLPPTYRRQFQAAAGIFLRYCSAIYGEDEKVGQL